MKKLKSGETMAGAVRKLQNDGTIAQLEMPGAMGVSMIVVKDLPWRQREELVHVLSIVA